MFFLISKRVPTSLLANQVYAQQQQQQFNQSNSSINSSICGGASNMNSGGNNNNNAASHRGSNANLRDSNCNLIRVPWKVVLLGDAGVGKTSLVCIALNLSLLITTLINICLVFFRLSNSCMDVLVLTIIQQLRIVISTILIYQVRRWEIQSIFFCFFYLGELNP